MAPAVPGAGAPGAGSPPCKAWFIAVVVQQPWRSLHFQVSYFSYIQSQSLLLFFDEAIPGSQFQLWATIRHQRPASMNMEMQGYPPQRGSCHTIFGAKDTQLTTRADAHMVFLKHAVVESVNLVVQVSHSYHSVTQACHVVAHI